MDGGFILEGIFFEPDRNIITINGIRKRIEPKTMMLICFLAKRAEQVVTKEEIINEIWQGVVVGDEAVSRVIFNLRTALGDDAKSPKFIETVPKKGYRLKVRPSFPNQNKKEFVKRAGLVASVLLLVTLGLLFESDKSSSKKSIADITSITNKSGLERHFSFNNSNSEVMYVHVTSSSSQIFSKKLDSGDLVQLTDSNSKKRSPIWLSDNVFLFIESHSNSYQITRQNKSGSSEVIYQSDDFIYWIRKAGQQLFFTEELPVGAQLHIQLKVLDLVSGEQQNLSSNIENAPEKIMAFDVSDNGEIVYFTNDLGALFKLNVEKSNLVKQTDGFSQINHLQLLDEDTVLVSGAKQSTSGVWKLDTVTNNQELIFAGIGGQLIEQSNLMGHNLYYSTYQFDTDIHVQLEGEAKLLEAINTNYNELYPKFLPLKNQIVFVSNRGGGYDLWQYDIKSQTTTQLSQVSAKRMAPPAISRNGKKVAIAYEKSGFNLSVVDLESNSITTSITSEFARFPLGWSSDNMHVFYSEYANQHTLFKIASDLTESQVVSQNAGLVAYQRPNDQALIYADYSENALITKNQQHQTLSHWALERLPFARLGDVIANEAGVFVASRSRQGLVINQIGTQPLGQVQVFNLPAQSQLSDVDNKGVAAAFYMRSPDGPQGDIAKVRFNP